MPAIAKQISSVATAPIQPGNSEDSDPSPILLVVDPRRLPDWTIDVLMRCQALIITVPRR